MFANIKAWFLLVHWMAKKKVIKWTKMSRSSRPEVFCKKVILKHFGTFSRKNLQWSVFLPQLQISGAFIWILRNFQRYWENCVLFSSVQEWLVGCFWPFWCVYTFTQSIKFYYTLYYTYKEYRCLENVIHQIDSKKWMVAPSSKYPYLYFLWALEFYLTELFPCEYP